MTTFIAMNDSNDTSVAGTSRCTRFGSLLSLNSALMSGGTILATSCASVLAADIRGHRENRRRRWSDTSTSSVKAHQLRTLERKRPPPVTRTAPRRQCAPGADTPPTAPVTEVAGSDIQERCPNLGRIAAQHGDLTRSGEASSAATCDLARHPVPMVMR